MSGLREKGTSSRNRRWQLKRLSLISVFTRSIGSCVLGIAFLASSASAQQALTWDQVKAKFEAVNPVLKADAANVEEMKAEEITAFLRPNPQFTLSADGTQIAPHNGVWTPFKGTTEQPNFSYLHEREHKRELRLESAKEGTRDHPVPARGPGTQSDLRPALGLCADSAGQGCAGAGQGRPGVLRQDHRDQPRPLQSRRPGQDRPGPNRTSARAIRV